MPLSGPVTHAAVAAGHSCRCHGPRQCPGGGSRCRAQKTVIALSGRPGDRDDERMTIAIAMPASTEVMLDRRNEARALRVSWHVPDDMFVISIWRDDRCTATFQLIRSDAPRLISCIAEGLATPSSAWSNATHAVARSPLSRARDQILASRHWIAGLSGRRKAR